MRRATYAFLALLLAAAATTGILSPARAAAQDSEPVQDDGSEPRDGRVLLLSVPGLNWADLQEHDLPVIEGFLEEAAVAAHAPRSARTRSTSGGAYLTISAGARAASYPSVDGQQLDLEDRSAGSAAGEIFERRTGVTPDGDYVALAWPDLLRRNAAQPYDAEPGLLAGTLQEAGLGAGVVGNADGIDTVADSYERQVGLAVVTPDGVVPSGDLDVDLLTMDTARPFGRRLDNDRVLERFTELWEPSPSSDEDPGLVVVEASDMARTLRYRNLVDTDRYDELWAQSLADADELAGQVLAEVDPERDSVILLAPYNQPGSRDLTVAALQTPDARAAGTTAVGYLRSASTQRSGFVTLVDIAPTILELLDVQPPAAMEGRPFEVVSSSDSLDTRVDRMVSANAASRFREQLLVSTTLLIVVLLGVVSAAAIACLARPDRPEWVTRLVTGAALGTLSLMPMSYVTRAFPLQDLGMGFYWGFVLASALAVAGVATALAMWLGRPRLALVMTLGIAVMVPALDVMTGSRLHMSAPFGYSPTGNSRLYGISNYALGMFVVAVCLLSALVASRGPERRNKLLAVGMMVAALVVIGVPIWGSNVGGILSFSPVVVIFATYVLSSRIRLRTMLVGFLVMTTAAIGVFASLDLARPPSQRAHLGRLMERIGDDGPGVLVGFIERKGLAAIQVSFTTFWTASVVIAVVLLVFLGRQPGQPLERLRERIPFLQAGLTAAFAAAIFGSIANDSGSIVGGTAMLVVAVALVCLTLEPVAVPTPTGSKERERSEPAQVGSPA